MGEGQGQILTKTLFSASRLNRVDEEEEEEEEEVVVVVVIWQALN